MAKCLEAHAVISYASSYDVWMLQIHLPLLASKEVGSPRKVIWKIQRMGQEKWDQTVLRHQDQQCAGQATE
jgi:hypothetical protein